MFTPPIRQASVVINGRHVEPGTELSITGVPGRYRFRYIDVFDNGRPAEVTVVGGPTGYSSTRTFYLDRVRTVHRVAKARPA